MTARRPTAAERVDVLLDHEIGAHTDVVAVRRAAGRVLARFVEVMTPLFGLLGFTALLQRALYITRQRYPWFCPAGVELGVELDLEGLGKALEEHGSEQARLCAAHLLATLITLSESFIGEDLTERALRRGWPTSRADDEPVQGKTNGDE